MECQLQQLLYQFPRGVIVNITKVPKVKATQSTYYNSGTKFSLDFIPIPFFLCMHVHDIWLLPSYWSQACGMHDYIS